MAKKFLLTKPSQLPKNVKGASLVFDTETTGLDYMRDTPFMFSLDVDGKKQYAVEWTDSARRWLEDKLPTAQQVICHNAKYDAHMLVQGGVSAEVAYGLPLICTAVQASLINEHEYSFGLDALGAKYGLGVKDATELYVWLADKFGGEANTRQMKNVVHAPRDMVGKYAIGDVVLTRALHNWQKKQIKVQELGRVVDLETRVLPVLARMERRGIPVNRAQLSKSKKVIAELVGRVEGEIYRMVGSDLNVKSPKQMKAAFEKLGIPLRLTPKGNPTFAKKAMEQINHPFAKLIPQMTSYRQIRDAFIDGFEHYIHEDGCVHTSFNQLRGDEFGTGTGRLSSSNPNMQQSPKRNAEMGAITRSLFKAPPGHVWHSGDWSQFEFRIFGHYTQAKGVIEAYKANPDADFHQTTADLTGVARNPFAKQINLGLIFGMGEGKLAMELGLPCKEHIDPDGKVRTQPGPEAKAIFDKYHGNLPEARKFLKMAANVARSRGYVKTLYGRRIRFPNPQVTYKAGGTCFQGTAADLMKEKAIIMDRELHHVDGVMRSLVHDEFNVTGPRGSKAKRSKLMKEIMEDIPELRIPIKADIGTASNWWDACKEDGK